MKHTILKLVYILAICSFSVTYAEITWDQNALTIKPIAGSTLETGISYKNETGLPIQIIEIKPGCSCTVVQDFKKILRPGESGTLKLKYNATEKIGKIHVDILVKTATGDSSIALQGEIVEWVKVKPRLLVWNIDEKVSPQIIELELMNGARASIAPISDSNVEANIDTSISDKISISLAPKQTVKPINITVPLEITRTDESARVQKNVIVVTR